MFTFTSFAFVFFRAENFGAAIEFVRSLFLPGELFGWPVMQTALLCLCFALHLAERYVRLRLTWIQNTLAPRRWSLAAEALASGAVLGLAVACSGAGGEFIYFQF